MSRLAVKAALVATIVAGGAAMFEPAAQAAEPAATGQADPMTFARGAKTWSENCARCHNMRDPKELRDDQWRAAVAHMRVRAGLTGQETRDVLKFLQESN